MKNTVFKEADYKDHLTKDERQYLYCANLGFRSGSRKHLRQIVDNIVAEKLARKFSLERDARKRDVYAKFLNEGDANFPLIQQGGEGLSMSNLEDALIEMIDLKNERPIFHVYGGNSVDLRPGDCVVVAIEGHYLQNKIGVVINVRAGQYLIDVELKTKKVQAYFNNRDLIQIKRG